MKIATHNGSFHTDDVFAIAVLQELFPDAEIIRSRDDEVLKAADIVVDVGKIFDPDKKRFDHHQRSAGARPNGILYSGFGLVWQAYGLKFCDGNKELWQRIDQQLVQHIDAHDNGQKTYQVDKTEVEPYLIEDIIRLYNPSPFDDTEANSYDARFFEAVAFAAGILKRLKKKEQDALAGEAAFMNAYRATDDKRYVVLDKGLPFKQRILDMPDLLYVVFPYETGESWLVEAVPVAPGSFESRRPLPTEWRGLDQSKLRDITGVADATFCHNTGFVGGAVSKDGALQLLKKALETGDQNNR